jgi:hypothetical protein
MEKKINTDFDVEMENHYDLGDYPDGFNPDLYDL